MSQGRTLEILEKKNKWMTIREIVAVDKEQGSRSINCNRNSLEASGGVVVDDLRGKRYYYKFNK